jgi:hypothetical protein
MNTRSKSKANNNNNNYKNDNDNALYEVNINFDEACEAWRSNKKHTGNGMYKYICCGITKTGKKCNRQPLFNSDYCKLHKKIDLNFNNII